MDVNTNRKFVVDASFILAYLLNEKNAEVERIMQLHKKSEITLVSLSLLKYEVGNTLRTAVLKKRINKQLAVKVFLAFLDLKITEEKIDYNMVLKKALSNQITFYDVSYLYLAQNCRLPLLTLDSSLRI